MHDLLKVKDALRNYTLCGSASLTAVALEICPPVGACSALKTTLWSWMLLVETSTFYSLPSLGYRVCSQNSS